MKIIDISRNLFEAKKYPTAPDTTFAWVDKIEHGADSNFCLYFSNTHAGTHIDAFSHFEKDGLTIGQMPLDLYYGSIRVVSFPEKSMLTKADLKGRIEGCERLGINGHEYTYLTAEAAEYIVTCGIKLVVTDGWSPGPPDNEKIVHQALLGNQVGIVENVDFTNVPDGEYKLIAFPVHYGWADGAPCRAVLIKE